MSELEELKGQITELTKKVEDLSSRVGQRIRWKESETESGIKLQQNTTVIRTGLLVSASVLPTAGNAITIFAIAKRDDGQVSIINGPFEFIDK